MSNRGNTGNRYRIRTVVAAEINERGGITRTLNCGHVVHYGGPIWRDSFTADEAQADIGKRMGCYECVKD